MTTNKEIIERVEKMIEALEKIKMEAEDDYIEEVERAYEDFSDEYYEFQYEIKYYTEGR